MYLALHSYADPWCHDLGVQALQLQAERAREKCVFYSTKPTFFCRRQLLTFEPAGLSGRNLSFLVHNHVAVTVPLVPRTGGRTCIPS